MNISLTFLLQDRLHTSESDICRRQILRYKNDPRTERIIIFLMAIYHNIGIQMKQKKLTKTFMMILN